MVLNYFGKDGYKWVIPFRKYKHLSSLAQRIGGAQKGLDVGTLHFDV